MNRIDVNHDFRFHFFRVTNHFYFFESCSTEYIKSCYSIINVTVIKKKLKESISFIEFVLCLLWPWQTLKRATVKMNRLTVGVNAVRWLCFKLEIAKSNKQTSNYIELKFNSNSCAVQRRLLRRFRHKLSLKSISLGKSISIHKTILQM